MSDDKQTTEAREASQSRVTTQETILANLATEQAASAPSGEKPEPGSKEEQPKPKHSPQERIREAIERRNKAEQEADQAKREAAELRARLDAMATQAPAQEAEKPDRTKFASDEEYIEALADWKAKQAIIQREREQADARAKAEADEIVRTWNKRQEQAMKDIPDYEEVVGAADIQIAAHVHQAIVESELGPHLAYYLALNQDEVKRLNAMKPIAAVRHLLRLEDELREEEPAKVDPKPPKSKAPEPISPVRDAPASSPGAANSFEEYKRRREAGK